MTFQTDIQKPVVGKLVELYEIDLRPLGGQYMRLTPSVSDVDSQPPVWRGQTYTIFPVEASGFETSGKGQFPRPLIRLSNALRLAEAAINEFGELLGAVVTRWRVFESNLDNGSDPDPDRHFPKEMFKINRRTAHNAVYIEFELASYIDQEGKQLPSRQITSTCSHTYRVWNPETEDFDYTNVTCPYFAPESFDNNENPVDRQNDKCSHKFAGCRKRFGSAPLPFQGFLGLKRQGE